MHPITGESISSYKHLMNDPVTADIWMMVFGKDFGSMSQGNNKWGRREQMQCLSSSQWNLTSPKPVW
jgi:hypothetical protein